MSPHVMALKDVADITQILGGHDGDVKRWRQPAVIVYNAINQHP